MNLREIDEERRNTRLKTKRWHELNQMEKDRTVQINVENGGEANPSHDQGFHRHMIHIHEIRRGRQGFFRSPHQKRMDERIAHHKKLEEAFKKEDYRVYFG